MKYTLQPSATKMRREFSFAEPSDISNDNSRSKFSSPSIAYEYGINYSSKEKQLSASPLHNLHYKYLPNDYQQREQALRFKYQEKPVAEQRQKSNKLQNMGEINKKIKTILDSIENQEKRKDHYCQKYARNMPSENYRFSRPLSRFDGQSPIQSKQIPSMRSSDRYYAQQVKFSQERTRVNSNRVKETQMIRSNFRTPLRERNQFERGSNEYSNMSSIKTQKKYESPVVRGIQKEIISHKLVTCPDDAITAESHLQYNSRINNSVYSNLPSSRFVENKQNQASALKQKYISSQIDKIQQQIEELEKIKRELKNDYDKTTASNIKLSIITKQCNPSKESSEIRPIQSCKSSIADILKESQICPKDAPTKRQNETIEQQRSADVSFNDTGVIIHQLIPGKKEVNEQDVYVPKLLRNLQSKQKKTVKKTKLSSQSEVKLETSFKANKENAEPSLPLKSEIVVNSTEQPKDNNLVNRCERDQVEDNEVKGLLHHIDEQIKLDEIFRKIKKWFQRCRSQDKWKALCVELKGENLWMSEQSMREVFTISSEEENPFYTPRQSDFNVKHLVAAFRETEEHWAACFLHKYVEGKLVKGGFTEENIDISKRGFIAIEDLVRYINYEMDSFFRNRDVYLIYTRFKKGQKLLFGDMFDCLGGK